MMHTKAVDCILRNFRWLILGGLVLSLTCRHLGWVGTFTGGAAIWLGACGGAFRQWRIEPGLWMLSGLFLALTLPAFAILASGSISEVAQAGVPNFSACDTWFANLFLAVQILFLATVTGKNWSLLKKLEPPEP
jgi:hypothetical protein